MLTTNVVSFIIIGDEEMHMSKYIGTVSTALIVITGVVLGSSAFGEGVSNKNIQNTSSI